MRNAWMIGCVLALGACTDKPAKDGEDTDTVDTEVVDTDTVDTDVVDTDTVDTEVVDTDTVDTDAPVAESCVLTPSAGTVTTRETVSWMVEATYVGGTTADVSGEVTVDSDDGDVLTVYVPAEAQPLGGGTATLTASYSSGGQTVTCDADVTVTVALAAPGDLVINELLADPDGDPNQDGTSDAVEDEFVEIANLSDVTVDLSGVTLTEQDFLALPRHTFPADTVLRAGEAIVVFGGGDVSALSAANATFQTVVNGNAGLIWGLNLNNGGETVRLNSADGLTVLAELSYGSADTSGIVPAPSGASVTLSPDVWGSTYVAHDTVGDSESPGLWADGSTFEGPDARYAP